jgi:hypothetical protein
MDKTGVTTNVHQVKETRYNPRPNSTSPSLLIISNFFVITVDKNDPIMIPRIAEIKTTSRVKSEPRIPKAARSIGEGAPLR